MNGSRQDFPLYCLNARLPERLSSYYGLKLKVTPVHVLFKDRQAYLNHLEKRCLEFASDFTLCRSWWNQPSWQRQGKLWRICYTKQSMRSTLGLSVADKSRYG